MARPVSAMLALDASRKVLRLGGSESGILCSYFKGYGYMDPHLDLCSYTSDYPQFPAGHKFSELLNTSNLPESTQRQTRADLYTERKINNSKAPTPKTAPAT
ncbi:hypothetical protein GCM10027565_45720 [Bordetella tumulicola]